MRPYELGSQDRDHRPVQMLIVKVVDLTHLREWMRCPPNLFRWEKIFGRSGCRRDELPGPVPLLRMPADLQQEMR